MNATISQRLIFWSRNLRYRRIFDVLRRVCTGSVLDIGGGFFFEASIRKQNFQFDHWIILEPNATQAETVGAQTVIADGCTLPFESNSFDTILCIHVLEHVFEPNKLIAEISRVLKPGAQAVIVFPQTAGLHSIPQIYYNFTPYWIEKALQTTGLTIEHYAGLGGVWSSVASDMAYFFFKIFNLPGYSETRFQSKRPFLFYPLLPVMILAAIVLLPLGLILSLGDLREEANNHIVVAVKPRS